MRDTCLWISPVQILLSAPAAGSMASLVVAADAGSGSHRFCRRDNPTIGPNVEEMTPAPGAMSALALAWVVDIAA
jgi:hypothetical protein